MRIKRETDYAVRVVVHLAMVEEGALVTGAELADAAGAPAIFMAKVLQKLVRSGVLTSVRGGNGGFRLGINRNYITLLQVVESVEGPFQINGNLRGARRSKSRSWRASDRIWKQAQIALQEALGGIRLHR